MVRARIKLKIIGWVGLGKISIETPWVSKIFLRNFGQAASTIKFKVLVKDLFSDNYSDVLE